MRKGGLRTEETVKDVNGRLLRGNEARKRWAEYFEELLNVQEDREADIVAVGGVQVPVIGEENETGSRSPCMRPRSDPPNFGPIERGEKQTNNID